MNTLNASGKTSITIDGSILLRGDYSVSNNDLIISTDSDTTLIKNYFIDKLSLFGIPINIKLSKQKNPFD